MRKAILTLLVLILSNPAFGLGRVVSYKEIQSLHFDSIQKITTCGSWKTEKFSGEFRVIQLFLYGQDMLFVDMVHPNENGSELIAEYGFTFEEINNDHAEISFKNVKCHPIKPGKIRITADAESGHDGKKFKFELTIDGKLKSYRYKEIQVKR